MKNSGWLTISKLQPCNVCWAYASVGVVESLVNLYFNEHYSVSNPTYHHTDLDLSEWQVVVCTNHDCNDTTPYPEFGWPMTALDYIQTDSICDEACLPQTNLNDTCGDLCADPLEQIVIETNDSIHIYYTSSSSNNEDWLRKNVIKYGPLACSIKNWLGGVTHSMVLIGYKPINENDLVYSDPNNPANDIYIEKGSPLIGTSTWIFKNSADTTWGEYGFTYQQLSYDRFSTYYYMNRKILGDIFRYGHSDADIQCVDEDGDGYYWWGVHNDTAGIPVNPQLCNCPDSITNAELEDCDDSDPDVGPYNLGSVPGPLYECLPKCDDFSDNPYVIRANDSITRDRHFNRNLVVNPGNTLVIKNCKVSFSGQAKLLVKRGAKLVVDNATLTTKCQNTMWQGVEVWGNSDYPQSDTTKQGFVDIKHGSVIENARIGVTTVNYEYVPEGDTTYPIPTYSGGKIKATEAEFKNNTVAIEFYPYRYLNESEFKSCSFKTTPDLVIGEPDYFIRMNGVHGVDVLSCSFVNTWNTDSNYFAQWGGGIYSFNSSVTVNKLSSSSAKCKFQKLFRGIYALNSGDDKSINIENTDFTNNYRAIFLSGMGSINTARIVLNDIQIQEPDPAIEQYPYGLYLDYCTGYKVEANSFWSKTRDYPTIGLIVNNSGPDYNIIYRNVFKTLYAGILAQNRNRNENGTSGLELKCNIFSGLASSSAYQCRYDISVTVSDGSGNEYGIRQNQGLLNSGEPGDCAGNVFSNDSISGSQWQYLNYGNYINYNHHAYGKQGELVVPDTNRINDEVYLYTHPYSFIYIESCESDLDESIESTDSIKDKLAESKNTIDSLENVLAETIDGGNTEEMTFSVQSSFPPDSIPLRNDLLIESPYLSDTVLISAIAQESVLSSEMVTEILSANPHAPKSNQVLQAVVNRNEALSDEQMGLIFEGLAIIGPKEHIEADLSAQKSINARNLYKLLRYYRENYPVLIATDSIYSLITEYGDLQMQYELISDYLALEDTVQVFQIFSVIPTMFTLVSEALDEYESFEDYLGIRMAMISNRYNILNPDSMMKSSLYEILAFNKVPSSTFARNILIATDTLLYFEPIVLPEPGLKQAKIIRPHKAVNYETPLFTLYPNPATSYLIAKYDFIKTGGLAHIDFLDASGHVCKQIPLKPGSGFEVINITDLPSGMYLCRYYTEDYHVSTIKVCILR